MSTPANTTRPRCPYCGKIVRRPTGIVPMHIVCRRRIENEHKRA